MPVRISVDASGLRDLAGKFRKAASAGPDDLRTEMAALGRRVRDTARAEAPVRTGALRSSIGYRTAVAGATVTVTVQATAKHAAMVHEGTRPHVILPRKGRFLRFPGKSGIVYARIVHHPGTKPNPFLKRAATEADMGTRARRIAARMVARLGG